ncbi:S49 family peptidase [Luteimonas sp. FCS-9]|uniref:S49 family peptidase n=1 Tax=Luteimonas sp. FCS-9 TaxID=1547516 RepID=UPI0018CD9777|nr:S49 family peptidase [Luteimonas sp. FCS-9]
MLARLFGRAKPAPVVSSLATAVLNRPLLADRAMAEQLVNAYLSGEVTSLDTQLSTDRVPGVSPAPEAEAAGMIGVINISGGLVNRPMPGPSGGGPVSYTALREAFDELLHDDGISAIVLRIESPGGMASGMFDLTDHIYASRGQKPIHALVDDYAYSAAYGIAAACDEIWVSRTGGAGSVGVCAFHYDWSGNDAQIGLKVTPIYAGDRKIDFNPHFPLSEEAHARALESVDATYGLFVKSVAQYRGIDEAVVRSTQADVYYGDRAVAAGLATRLGTWDDLVAHLGAPGVDAPEQEGDDGEDGAGSELTAAPPVTGAESDGDAEGEGGDADAPPGDPSTADGEAPAPDEAAKLAAAGSIARAVTAAGLAPDLAVALLGHVQEVAEVPRELERARGIADLCRAADLRSLAPELISSGASLEQVRAQLDGATASVGDELVTAQPTQNTAAVTAAVKQAESLDPNRVYARRNNPRGATK